MTRPSYPRNNAFCSDRYQDEMILRYMDRITENLAEKSPTQIETVESHWVIPSQFIIVYFTDFLLLIFFYFAYFFYIIHNFLKY